MDLWMAFIVGLAGSLHCAGMCGPLVLALPATGGSRASFFVGRVVNNLGRIMTYGLLGIVFGLIGQTFALAGLQRWVSLAAGLAIFSGLAASPRRALNRPAFKTVAWLKSALANLLRRRSLASLFSIGLLNGLLPCGLVYVACAGAVATGGFFNSVAYMLAFGAGTLPMMISVALAGQKLRTAFRLKLQRFIPVCIVLVGALLILRGMSLGIPFLSPDLSGATAQSCACHPVNGDH
jgi:sulfite exporter TauE/SafE